MVRHHKFHLTQRTRLSHWHGSGGGGMAVAAVAWRWWRWHGGVNGEVRRRTGSLFATDVRTHGWRRLDLNIMVPYSSAHLDNGPNEFLNLDHKRMDQWIKGSICTPNDLSSRRRLGNNTLSSTGVWSPALAVLLTWRTADHATNLNFLFPFLLCVIQNCMEGPTLWDNQ